MYGIAELHNGRSSRPLSLQRASLILQTYLLQFKFDSRFLLSYYVLQRYCVLHTYLKTYEYQVVGLPHHHHSCSIEVVLFSTS